MSIQIDKQKQRLQRMNPQMVKNLIKDIFDERKHNRSMSESELSKLKELEKAAEKRLSDLKVLNEHTKKEYNAWKKKMDNEKRCY